MNWKSSELKENNKERTENLDWRITPSFGTSRARPFRCSSTAASSSVSNKITHHSRELQKFLNIGLMSMIQAVERKVATVQLASNHLNCEVPEL